MSSLKRAIESGVAAVGCGPRATAASTTSQAQSGPQSTSSGTSNLTAARWRGTKLVLLLAAAVAGRACTALEALLGEGRAPGLGGGRGLGTSSGTTYFLLGVDAVGAVVGPMRGAGWGPGS